MKSSHNLRTLLIALMLATAAAVGVYVYSNNAQESAPKQEASSAAPAVTSIPTTAVLIAKQDVPAHTTITAEMVEVKEIPAGDKNARALTTPEEVVGKITTTSLANGEQVLSSRLTTSPEDARAVTFAYEVPVGKRAISLVFSEVIGAGALVQPGDHVDVLAYFGIKVKEITSDPATEGSPGDQESSDDNDGGVSLSDKEDEAEYTQYSSVYVVQDVEVLWVAQAIEPQDDGVLDQPQAPEPTPTPSPESTAEATATATAEETGDPVARPTAISVTLAVTPEQAQRLQLAAMYVDEEGKTGAAGLRLALRSPGDTTTLDLPPAQLGEIPIGGLLGNVNQQLVPSDVFVTDFEFTRTTLPVGEVLEFKATVKNVSDKIIVSGKDAPPEFTYTQGTAYDELGFYAEPGTYRLGLNFEGASPEHYPYRWSLGRDLKPGESIEVVGSIKMTKPATAEKYWVGVILESDIVTHDGAGVETITVLQPSEVVVRDAANQLRSQPFAAAPVVTDVKQGDRLTVLETQGDWFRVQIDSGTSGWVAIAAVDVAPPATTDPGTPVIDAEATPVSATPEST